MSATKPLTLYHTGPSPNPWKVAIILEELNIPYTLSKVADVKGSAFTAINPNGRVPALEDPNTGITTWESGSCIEYLIETYDKAHSLSYAAAADRFEENNWKHFQMSGQGPYFGQRAWFANFHPEKIQSAIDRYTKEIDRVLSVIELRLSKTGKPYLVGSNVSYVDLMFVPWNGLLGWLLGPEFNEKWQKEYPKSYQWHQSLTAREGVKKMEEKKAAALAA